MKKSLTALLLTTVFLVSAIAPLMYTQVKVEAVANPDSRTVMGVLGTDTYVLYPYAANSLNIGFSKYGELIDNVSKTGLSYNGTDPFAPPGGSPPENQWIEGWILNMTFVEGGAYRNLWAMALYSDYSVGGVGGPWHEGLTVGSTDLSVRGGRKTSGGAVTDPITVLYDGPRRYVALLHTTIYETPDHLMADQLLSLTFTIDFNKVSKQVVIYKDVKRIDIGKNIDEMQIEFGDRGEWDLGSGTPPKSYGKFYITNPTLSTVYDHNWQPWYANAPVGYDGTYTVAQIIDSGLNYAGWAAFWPRPISSWIGATQEEATRNVILTTISTVTETQVTWSNGSEDWFVPAKGTPYAYPQNTTAGVVWKNDPMVFVNGQHMVINSSDHTYGVTYFEGNYTVKFYPENIPGPVSNVTLVYKVCKDKPEMSSEPNSPFVIGEWCFDMISSPEIFRGVTIYGLTDRHDADDSDRLDSFGRKSFSDVIDKEAKYQLDQHFNPWDLYSAIEKKTDRWVEFPPLGSSSWTTTKRPVVLVDSGESGEYMWTQYSQFVEKVEDLNTSKLLHRSDDTPLQLGPEDYDFTVDNNGYGQFTDLISTHLYKITYSTYNTITTSFSDYSYNAYNAGVNGTVAATEYYNSTSFENGTYTGPDDVGYTDIVGAQQEFDFNWSHTLTLYNASATKNGTLELKGSLVFNVTDIKVWKENVAHLNLLKIDATNDQQPGSWHDIRLNSTDNASIDLSALALNWTITPPLYTDLHIDSANITLAYDITVNYFRNTTNWQWNSTYTYTVTAQIMEHVPGRWEWGVVGKNSASVDSAGLSMVSAAFKNKQVEYGLAGEDMYDSNVANQMPWVMSKVGSGTSSSDYYYGTTDYRTGLKDDWCTTWPVSSSNIIGVGGPIANMFSYYGNDFADAFYGNQFASGIWAGNIAALSCWNKSRSADIPYTSSNTTGYGVISTFQDPNGTVGLLLWGVWGRDTYYLTKWFHEEGIYELQQAPRGLTSIIVEIDYKAYPEGYKPTAFKVVECLGTISETEWTGTLAGFGSFDKGGIHDP